MKNRRYGRGLAVLALLGGTLLGAPPGCFLVEDTCVGVASKLCDKACTCGAECKFGSGEVSLGGGNAACVTLFTNNCANETASVDYGACSVALDTAECNKDVLVLPAACTGGGAGDGGTSTSSSTGGTSSSSTGSK
jgi:hypothetical protein